MTKLILIGAFIAMTSSLSFAQTTANALRCSLGCNVPAKCESIISNYNNNYVLYGVDVVTENSQSKPYQIEYYMIPNQTKTLTILSFGYKSSGCRVLVLNGTTIQFPGRH